jgi:RNA polymerase sigma-70 factor (ECF subfamily)
MWRVDGKGNGKGGINIFSSQSIHKVVSTTALDVHSARETDEASLVARARAGDERAADVLVRRYLGAVYAITFRILIDRDLAQDAAQEAFINALRGLQRFRGDASFRTWLLRIAVNAARTVARRQYHRREVPLEAAADAVSHGRDAASVVALHDEAARAAKVLETLPEKQRMAVSLRVQQGLSYQEIGVVLDCTEGAARVNYHLGVKRLRELLK